MLCKEFDMCYLVFGQINEIETSMILTINRVYLQHFKTYIFEAENDVGRVTREISLEQGNICCSVVITPRCN
jgi:hypothetical protein